MSTTIKSYYNENDPFAAAWLRELMKAGVITDGDVDERSIEDVVPSDVRGYTRCHFFAGIGVWDYALTRAGWGKRPVWTGSCPCQPFSTAGKRKGTADERHLWPALFHLIQQGKPKDVPVFGEQVASKDGLAWIDTVQADMEAENHAFWPFDLCAAGFGAPHIRQRLYFVADSTSAGRARRVRGDSGEKTRVGRVCLSGGQSTTDFMADAERDWQCRGDQRGLGTGRDEVAEQGNGQDTSDQPSNRREDVITLADTAGERRQPGRGWSSQPGLSSENAASHSETGKLADTGRSEDYQQGNAGSSEPGRNGPHDRIPSGSSGELRGAAGELDYTGITGRGARVGDNGKQIESRSRWSHAGRPDETNELGQSFQSRLEGLAGPESNGNQPGRFGEIEGGSVTETGPTNGFWRDAEWLWCRDEKFRPVESGSFPLAYGSPNRVGRLRGYGNALVAAQAEEFIRAYLDITKEQSCS